MLTNVSAARKQWHELAGCTTRGSCLWEDRTSKIARKRCCSFFPLNWMSYLSSMYVPWRLTGNMFLLAEDGVTNIPKYYFLPTHEIYLKILIPNQQMKLHNFSVHRIVWSWYVKNVHSWCVNCLHLSLPSSFRFHLGTLLGFETLCW